MSHDSRSTKRGRLALAGAALLATAGMAILAVIASQGTPVAETSPNGTSGPVASSSARRPGDNIAEIPPTTGRLLADAGIGHPSAMEYRLRDAVGYLASDELEGRGLGTRGIELAAGYIAEQFEQAGLRTDHYQGSPFQRFHRTERKALTGRNTLQVQGPDAAARSLSLRREYTPLSFTTSAEFDLPVVFAGYGITATEAGYDDYANLDVQGKAVILLRHEPLQTDPSSPLDGDRNSPHAFIGRKVTNAAQHGAAAVLLCTDAHTLRQRQASSGTPELLTDAGLALQDSLLNFHVRGTSGHGLIPVLQVQRDVIEQMVAQATAGELSELERQIDNSFAPRSCPLAGWSVAGEVQVGRVAGDLKNVIATLEGVGPLAEETVVVGAHYDHLGYGSFGSLAAGERAVHNGADDNASGTAVMLELARQLAARPVPLSRRVLFIAFTAEESGLVGSQHYAAHALVPLDQTVAMLNLDMIGWLRNDQLEVFGTGTAAEFEPLLSELGAHHELRILRHPSGYGPSDHASFFEHGIPVLHFFTGFHNHYHRPSDDVERLNISGMRRITELARELVVELANMADRPRFLRTTDFELLAGLSEGLNLPKFDQRPSLGVTGNCEPGRRGYVIRRLSGRGLAERHGFRPGDRIVRIDTREITTTSDFAEAIESLQRGTQVPFLLQRGNFELEVAVTID